MDSEEGVTLFVRKLRPDVKTQDVEGLFSEYGPLTKCFVVPVKDEKAASKGRVAFVTYSLKEDGLKAAELLHNKEYQGQAISVEPAKPKRELAAERPNLLRKFSKKPDKEKPTSSEPSVKKNARLIVRNVPFAADEKKLEDHFKSFGQVLETKLLRKGNGKLVGCGFVQFKTVHEAAKALKDLNAKPFLGRPIAVDWAIPKDKFESAADSTNSGAEDSPRGDGAPAGRKRKVKQEPKEEGEAGEDGDAPKEKKKRKRNPHRSRGKKNRNPLRSTDVKADVGEKEEDVDVKEENEEEDAAPKKKRKVVVKEEAASGDEDEEEEDDDDDDEDEEEEARDSKDTKEGGEKKPAEISRDVREGRTVFVDNVPFTSNEEDLEEFMSSQFGPVKYALFCLDPVTKHPRGTAFVQFESLESAEESLTAKEDKLMFDGRPLKIMKAIGRGGAKEKKEEHEKEKAKPINDKRNLYLAREGLIREGTQAAEGVSQHDMNMRRILSRNKKNALRDLTMFVSPNRLCIHNVPFAMDDAELKNVVKQHSPRGAAITECRIMKDRKSGNVSKGFAFVTFSRHEHALEALRTINNNPTVFSPSRRPIVEFSIENKLALLAREKRLARSKEKHPNSAQGEGDTGVSKKPLAKPEPNLVDEGRAPDPSAELSKPMSKHQKKRLKILKRFQEKRKRKQLGKLNGVPVPAASSDQPKQTSAPEEKVEAKGKGQPQGPRPSSTKQQGVTKDFSGAKSDPAKKGKIGMPSHEGPKVRHKARESNSISRKLLKKPKKKLMRMRDHPHPAELGGKSEPGRGEGGKKKAGNPKPTGSGTSKKMDKAGSDFQAMVEKYKSKLTASTGKDAGVKRKWFD